MRRLENRISTNPYLNAFQQTVYTYHIDRDLIDAFLKSMRMDLEKKDYKNYGGVQGLYLRIGRCGGIDVPEGVCEW